MIERHFTATAIVLNDEGRVLLLHHNKLDTWLPPGGHIEPNELPDDALLREVREETGIIAQILERDEDHDASDRYARVLHTPWYVLCEDIGKAGTHFHIDLVYLCHAAGDAVSNPAENSGANWYSLAQIKDMEMYHNTRAIITRAMKEYINAINR